MQSKKRTPTPSQSQRNNTKSDTIQVDDTPPPTNRNAMWLRILERRRQQQAEKQIDLSLKGRWRRLKREIRIYISYGFAHPATLKAIFRLAILSSPLLVGVFVLYIGLKSVLPVYQQAHAINSDPKEQMAGEVDLNNLIMSLPNGYGLLGVEQFFHYYPIAREGIFEEGLKIVMPGWGLWRGRERFAHISLHVELRDLPFDEEKFPAAQQAVMLKREVGKIVGSSRDDVIGPEHDTGDSVCFGRVLDRIVYESEPPERLIQYSCLMLVRNRLIVLTCGMTARPEEKPEWDGFVNTVLDWRDKMWRYNDEPVRQPKESKVP